MEDFLKKIMADSKGSAFGSRKGDAEIWYNEEGDCLQFQLTHVAVVRNRIDDYLTVYRSAVDSAPIGFQLKDIKALIQKYSAGGIVVKAEVDKGKLISVTALLVNILADLGATIMRREGYSEALQSFPKERDQILVPA